ELATRHPGLAIRLHLTADVGQRLALHVIAADRDDGQALAMAAQQRAHALAAGLSDEIPHGAIHAGDGFHERLAVSARMAEGEHLPPDSLGLEDAHSLHARRQLVLDEDRKSVV